MRLLRLLVLIIVVATACTEQTEPPTASPTQSSPTQTPTPTPSPTRAASPPSARELRRVRAHMVRFARASDPTAVTGRNGDDAVYATERTGRVVKLRRGRRRVLLDLRKTVTTEGERGMLGLAFSPKGDRLYVSFSDLEGDLHLREYAMRGDGVDERSARDLLVIDHPATNHYGGHVVVDPSGLVWFSVGDGGGAGDPEDDAQELDTLLGKLLRIDPRPDGGTPYSIPRTNPYRGDDDARPEVVAYGLRNPWRFSVDRVTRDVWVGDVGQYIVEEITFVPRARILGANFGWNRLEGNRRFNGPPPRRRVDPILTYGHDERRAVIGGVVYRGSEIEGLQGAYLFGDFYDGVVRALTRRADRLRGERTFKGEVPQLTSFGEDGAGEIYATSLKGWVYRLEKP